MSRYVVICCLLALAGCDSTLETGYKPNVLNASDSQRRAFYAPAFSPEAADAKQGQPTYQARRPDARP